MKNQENRPAHLERAVMHVQEKSPELAGKPGDAIRTSIVSNRAPKATDSTRERIGLCHVSAIVDRLISMYELYPESEVQRGR